MNQDDLKDFLQKLASLREAMMDEPDDSENQPLIGEVLLAVETKTTRKLSACKRKGSPQSIPFRPTFTSQMTHWAKIKAVTQDKGKHL